MKNSFGQNLNITLFGESHGDAVGAVVDGLSPGIAIDEAYIAGKLEQRRACGDISSSRHEPDRFKILSGLYHGRTTGSPICVIIENKDVQSEDYERNRGLARPGHADLTAFYKYHGFEDPRGGGHFSGRLTAPLVAAGAVAASALENKGILIGTHIKRCAFENDRAFIDIRKDLIYLNQKSFAVLDECAGRRMISKIQEAKHAGDSVGGILETAVDGLPAGLGEPWFDSLESVLSHLIFSIPGVKGIEFGAGFGFADLRGSEANDAYYMKDGRIVTETNHNGGINGGISNGMPVLFRTVVKPTPSVSVRQHTVDFLKKENTEVSFTGRYDPAIVHRARVVVDCLTAIVLADLLIGRYGADYLAESEE